jgi:hypothetical protein
MAARAELIVLLNDLSEEQVEALLQVARLMAPDAAGERPRRQRFAGLGSAIEARDQASRREPDEPTTRSRTPARNPLNLVI